MRYSSGLLLYRKVNGALEVLIGHMGGPFWSRRQESWTIPKGEHVGEEASREAARREFEEEMGTAAPEGDGLDLGETHVGSSKVVHVWAFEADFDTSRQRSNTFSIEWPKGSGRWQDFPELDRAAWVPLGQARRLLVASQRLFLDRLRAVADDAAGGSTPEARRGAAR